MLGNKEIAMVTKFKYLGIWIDHKLDFKRPAAEIRLTPLKDMLKAERASLVASEGAIVV